MRDVGKVRVLSKGGGGFRKRGSMMDFRARFGARARFILTMVLGLLMLLSIAGCTTLTTSMTSFPESAGVGTSVSEAEGADFSESDDRFDARELVELAVKTTNESEATQSFWFAGYIKNGFENRTTTSMYEGVAMRPEQAYLVNGRIAAQPFRYYRWGDTRYINRSNVWYRTDWSDGADWADWSDGTDRADRADWSDGADWAVGADRAESFEQDSAGLQVWEDVLPFDPFGGYTDWLPFLESAKALPDEAILSNMSHVIEVRINAKEWVERSSAPLFRDIKALLGLGDQVAAADEYEFKVDEQDSDEGSLSEGSLDEGSSGEKISDGQFGDGKSGDEQSIDEQLLNGQSTGSVTKTEQVEDEQVEDEQLAAFSHALENTIVKMTLWIGKEDHVIYQYSTWIVMPLPGAGYIDQETYFRFYHYDDPSIPNHIQTPDRIERWVLEFEEQQREGKIKGELEH